MNRKKHSLEELYLGRSTSSIMSEFELSFTPPKLYAVIASPPCRSVLMVAAAIGIPLEFIKVDITKGEQLNADYIKKNPQHTVPLLEENDFLLWDSHAISVYLITSYARNDSLYPRDPKRRALIDQRLHFDSSVLFARLLTTINQLMKGQNKVISDGQLGDLNEALQFLEEFLVDYVWVAGDNVTVADICLVATLSSIDVLLPLDARKYPQVKRWFDNCKKLSFYSENESGLEMFAGIMKSLMN